MTDKSIVDFIINITPEPIVDFFSKGQARTLKAKKHIAFSYLYRGLDMALGFLQVPLVLNYLDEERYGIWLILFSITEWFRFLDVGLEKGLRNRFAESLAKNEKEDAKYYVSTTYAAVSLISISFFILFLIVNPFLDWTKLLNTSPSLKYELSLLAIFVFGSFAFKFIFRIITTILVADQRPSISNLNGLVTRILKLGFLVLLINTTKGSLLKLGIVNSVVPVITLLLLSFYYFSKDYKEYKPSIKYVDFSYVKKLMELGIKFFIISVAGVVLFTTDNMIITQLYGPEEVTPYQIANRYFGLIFMLFLIIVQPLWSAVTDAYSKGDFKWIKNSIDKMRKAWYLSVVGSLLLLLISPFIFKIWIGDKVEIPILLSISWTVYVIVRTYNSIFTYFINGVGKLKIQILLTIFSIIINIPLSIFLAKYIGLGTAGVIVSTTIAMLINAILNTIQYNKIINKKAEGIWDQ